MSHAAAMKIIQMHEITGSESLATLLRNIDYIAIENCDHNTIQTVCSMEAIPSGGYHLKQCPDVIGLFVVDVSHRQSFLIVGPGNDKRPFYSTRDELRGSLINSLRDAPIFMRLKRLCGTMVCCSCSTASLFPIPMPKASTYIDTGPTSYTIE